jgi:hypothetical protein
MPHVANVCSNVAPGASVPESNRFVSEVTVCDTEPLFVQHTVISGPGTTRSGSNWKSWMSTCTEPLEHEPEPACKRAAGCADVRARAGSATIAAAAIATTPKPYARLRLRRR